MFEHTIIEVGSGLDRNWLKAQQETLEDQQAEGWELVTVVLIERKDLLIRGAMEELVSVAMYFKRPVLVLDGSMLIV